MELFSKLTSREKKSLIEEGYNDSTTKHSEGNTATVIPSSSKAEINRITTSSTIGLTSLVLLMMIGAYNGCQNKSYVQSRDLQTIQPETVTPIEEDILLYHPHTNSHRQDISDVLQDNRDPALSDTLPLSQPDENLSNSYSSPTKDFIYP